MPTPVRIFVLYSAKDKKLGLAEDLETHLALLTRNAEIVVDNEDKLAAGADLSGVADCIDRAEIILILVSANLMVSHAELVDRALARRAATHNQVRVIPILVRPFELAGSPLATLKPLPANRQPVSAWTDEDQAWVEVVRSLRQLITEVRASRSTAPTPLPAPPQALPSSSGPGERAPVEHKMKKVLLISANPSTDQRVAINKEFYEIKHRVEHSTYRDQIDVQMELEIRVTDLANRLTKHQPHILVFSGHGAPEGAILLVDPNHADQTFPMPLTALRDLVEVLRDNLCCVVLNACFSAGDEPLAQSIADVVGFAIGMNGEIDDRAAVLFSSSLLEMLAMGRTMHDAFRVAKTQIASMGVPGKDLPILKSASGADASKFVLVP